MTRRSGLIPYEISEADVKFSEIFIWFSVKSVMFQLKLIWVLSSEEMSRLTIMLKAESSGLRSIREVFFDFKNSGGTFTGFPKSIWTTPMFEIERSFKICGGRRFEPDFLSLLSSENCLSSNTFQPSQVVVATSTFLSRLSLLEEATGVSMIASDILVELESLIFCEVPVDPSLSSCVVASGALS